MSVNSAVFVGTMITSEQLSETVVWNAPTSECCRFFIYLYRATTFTTGHLAGALKTTSGIAGVADGL